MKLKIAPDLSVPVELLTAGTAILGIRGSGKTNTAVDIVEEALKASIPVCIIDPTGSWWGLRSAKDGKSAGLSVYILGGEHAHAPLEPTSGKIVAQFLVDKRVPVVLDLKLMRKGQQAQFVTDFAETLFHINREALPVIIDETARFCPQNLAGRPEMARCVGAIEDLVTLGRSRGLGAVLIGQRPALINKNVLTQCETIICLRTVSPQDRKALDEWVEAHGTKAERDVFMRDLATLPQGVGYVWSPSLLELFKKVHFRERETFDSSRTPKVGERIFKPTAFADVDLSKLTADIQSTIAKAAANDPAALKAHIAELERKLAAAKPTVETKVERIEVPVIPSDFLETLNALHEASESITGSLRAMAVKAGSTWEDEQRGRFNPAPQNRSPRAVPIRRNPPTGGSPRSGKSAAAEDVRLGGATARALGALAAFPGGTMTRRQLALAARIPVRVSTFRNVLSTLKGWGYIETVGDNVVVTSSGKAAAPSGNYDTESVVQMWRSKFGGATLRVFDILLDNPRGYSRDELATLAEIDPGVSTFRNVLSTLRGAGAIVENGDTIQLDEALSA